MSPPDEKVRDRQIEAATKAILRTDAFADFMSNPAASARDMATAAVDAANKVRDGEHT